MFCNVLGKRSAVFFIGMILAVVPMVHANEYPLLSEMLQVDDSCETTYADKLATCTPFKCRKLSPMAMMGGVPSEEDLQKMPPKRQQKVRATMAAAEKKMQGMSVEKRAAMKARMTSEVEIKGYDSQHQCQIETGISPKYVMRCAYDAPMLKRVIDYERIIAKAELIESDSSGSTVNGKWVTKSVTKVDGLVVDNPLAEAMNKKICLTMAKDADRGWIGIDQLNRMAHIELNLSEHGKHVDGHIQILNAADGKVLFDRDVNTSKNMRNINLKPGTFDIQVTSKTHQLVPVWFRGIKLGVANVFKKNIEFYAITGTLKLNVTVNGNPSKGAAIYMTDPKTGKWIYHSFGFNEHQPRFAAIPAKIKLPETLTGKYAVFVTPVKRGFKPDRNAKYEKFLLAIKNGETVEKTLDFGGTATASTQTTGKTLSHLVPLRLYWSESNQDNFVTATRKGADEALAAGYRFVRTEACIIAEDTKLAERSLGSQALKLFWSKNRGDHFSAASSRGEGDARAAGYQSVRTEGFILPFRQPGTVPLKLYWSPGRKDNFSTATLQSARSAETAGYRFSRIQGYVYPPSKCQSKSSPLSEDKVDVVAGKLNKSSISSNAGYSAKSSASANATPRQAQKTGKNANTLFILDASGSMWGQIKGKPKITIAKEVMAKLVPELPDNARIGLIAYGHRRKGDCNDVETLVKLGTNVKQVVLKAVNGLNAKGKTPLTRSVNQAIDMLRPEENASTVVLVSDGIESCGGDPCAAVKAAKASGVNFILHTVGFGLSKKESAQLQCMAKAGGGEYFQANNAEELLKSARKAVKSKGPGMLKLTLTANGKPVNAWVKLTGDGSTGLVEFTNDTGAKPGYIWHLRPGIYRLETYPAGLRGVDPVVADNIRIASGKTVDKQLDFDQSVLRVRATNNGKPAVVQIKLINLATNKTLFDTVTFSTFTMRGVKTPYEVKVPPGKYRLVVQLPTKSALTPHSEDIDIPSGGKVVEKTIDIETTMLRIIASKNGKPAKVRIYVDDLIAHRNIFNSDFLVSFGLETPYDIPVTPGRYRLTFALAANTATPPHVEELKITSGGKVVEKSVHFEVKPITVDANGMEQDTDRPGGGDFRHVTPASDNPALCQKACKDDAQCKSWTYVKPNTIQGPPPNCWLKTGTPPAVPNTCCVSGLKR